MLAQNLLTLLEVCMLLIELMLMTLLSLTMLKLFLELLLMRMLFMPLLWKLLMLQRLMVVGVCSLVPPYRTVAGIQSVCLRRLIHGWVLKMGLLVNENATVYSSGRKSLCHGCLAFYPVELPHLLLVVYPMLVSRWHRTRRHSRVFLSIHRIELQRIEPRAEVQLIG